ENEVRLPDQAKMGRSESLDEELFGMAPKTEHFAVTRLELLHVYLHVRLICARTRFSFPVRVLNTILVALNVRLSAHLCGGLSFCLRFALLLCGAFLFSFGRRCRLGFCGLPLCL